jgi:hypothetical protein
MKAKRQAPPGAAPSKGAQEVLGTNVGPLPDPLGPLRPALARLDERLRLAVELLDAAAAPGIGRDPFRGLSIGREDVDAILDANGRPPPDDGDAVDLPPLFHEYAASLPVDHLVRSYGLSQFDVDVLLLAIAPDLDVGYERLFAYLQDDVSRRRPTVGLALALLCGSIAGQGIRRDRFEPDAPLVAGDLVRLATDDCGECPLLSRALAVDDRVVRHLLGSRVLDRRLVHACETHTGHTAIRGGMPEGLRLALDGLVAGLDDPPGLSARLIVHGPGWRPAAAFVTDAIAAAGTTVLAVDGAALLDGGDSDVAGHLVRREAVLASAAIVLEVPATVPASELGRFLRPLRRHPGPVVVVTDQPASIDPGTALDPARWTAVRAGLPPTAERRVAWTVALSHLGVDVDPASIAAVAARFRLDSLQIEQAAMMSARGLRDDATSAGAIDADDGGDGVARRVEHELFQASRALGHEIDRLATVVPLVATWDDLVLPVSTIAQLREICARVRHHELVFGDWGFERRSSLGTGVSALFSGPSGTGKTMAAGIVAKDLGLELVRVDLSGVVSKYIGETEKNLDRIFGTAERANAILLFDEADALFGKRSEIRDSHDRYANVEISYLLQKMEAFEGIAILATNVRQNLDEAFLRRLAFVINLPFPDAAARLDIWRRIWPDDAPLAPDLDLAGVAEHFPLSGGNIRNAALAAAFLAADERLDITERHVLLGITREYQKMGKSIAADVELGPRPVAAGAGS